MPASKKDSRLIQIAQELGTAHTAATTHTAKSLEYAVAAGKLLVEAKSLLKHGKWTTWLNEHFEGDPSTARRYMKAARLDEAGVNLGDVSSLSDALRASRESEDKNPAASRGNGESNSSRKEPGQRRHEPSEPEQRASSDWGEEVVDEEYNFSTLEELEDFDPDNLELRTPQRIATESNLWLPMRELVRQYVHERNGEQKDRIQRIREELDLVESELLARAHDGQW